ncbi:MAG: AAA family ATPase, partial [Thermodesulfobacteriota bacterium]
VLDASYGRRREREYVVDLVDRLKVDCYFILCSCDEEVARLRLAAREKDPKAVSDAGYEIYQIQKSSFEYPDKSEKDRTITIDTDASVAELLKRLESDLANLQVQRRVD